MSEPAPPASCPVNAAAIGQAHQLYCQLTGQSLRLAFDRERMWYELLRLGYSLPDLHAVILYLQREIRAQRRNVGALNSPTSFNPTASKKTCKSAGCACAPRLPPSPPRRPRRRCPQRTSDEAANEPWNACVKSRPDCDKTPRT